MQIPPEVQTLLRNAPVSVETNIWKRSASRKVQEVLVMFEISEFDYRTHCDALRSISGRGVHVATPYEENVLRIPANPADPAYFKFAVDAQDAPDIFMAIGMDGMLQAKLLAEILEQTTAIKKKHRA